MYRALSYNGLIKRRIPHEPYRASPLFYAEINKTPLTILLLARRAT